MKEHSNETKDFSKVLQRLLAAGVFLIALVLQVVGQRRPGYGGLGLQFLSLALFLVLLWRYNCAHR